MTSPPLPSRDRQILDPEGNLPLPPPNESYSPPSLLENENVMRSNVPCMPHDVDARSNRDVGVVESHHVMSSDQSLDHVSADQGISQQLASGDHSLSHVIPCDNSVQRVTSGDQEMPGGVRGVASPGVLVMDMFGGGQSQVQNENETRDELNMFRGGQSQIQNGNETRDELNTGTNQFQRSGIALHAAESDRSPVNVGDDDGERYNQGDGPCNQLSRYSPVEEAEDKHHDACPREEESEAQENIASKPAQPAEAEVARSQDAPISQQGRTSPVINPLPRQPTAVRILKRCTYETYSSDDDDVFLPNPPSKSQADKCIVAMDTDEDVAAPVIVTTAASVSNAAPDNSEVVAMETPKETKENEEGEGGDDKAMESAEKAEERGEKCLCMCW